MIRELLKTEGADGALLSAIIEVTDDDGEIVLEFPFAEAILDAPDRPATKRHAGTDMRLTPVEPGPFGPGIAVSQTHVSGCAPTEKYRDCRSGKPPAPAPHVPRVENRLPPRENVHDEHSLDAAQPVARRRLSSVHSRLAPLRSSPPRPPAAGAAPAAAPRFRRARR